MIRSICQVASLRGSFLSRILSLHTSANYLRKHFSALPPTDPGYVDKWFREVIKSKTFYERHALEHRYFYNIDLEGRLYLEETYPKNIATSFKNEKFLNFFFRRLRYILKTSKPYLLSLPLLIPYSPTWN